VDAAVRVIADMVDLQPVTMENIYYVTTKENAERLRRQEPPKPLPSTPTPPAAKPAAPKVK
jgi:hypothetical protein